MLSTIVIEYICNILSANIGLRDIAVKRLIMPTQMSLDPGKRSGARWEEGKSKWGPQIDVLPLECICFVAIWTNGTRIINLTDHFNGTLIMI